MGKLGSLKKGSQKASKPSKSKRPDQQRRAVQAVQAALAQSNHVVKANLNPLENMSILEQVKLSYPSAANTHSEEKTADFAFIERMALQQEDPMSATRKKPSLADTMINSLKKITGLSGKKDVSEEYHPQWPSNVDDREGGWAEEEEEE